MPILRAHAPRELDRYATTVALLSAHRKLYFPVDSRFVRFRASGGAEFPKMEDSLHKTPTNLRAKFNAASFILAEEIRNCTSILTNKLANNKRYIHTLPISMCG